MTTARLAAVGVVVALAAGLDAAPALGAPNPAEREARHRFDEGEVQYRAGRYAEALAKYQQGYSAMPLPGFLVNIAQCQRRLGDLKTARATYREFVLVAPDSRLVPEVEALIKQLDALIADLASGGSGETAAQIGGDGDVHATDPAAPPLTLAPAAPVAEPALVTAPPSAATEAPPRRSHARWWLWGGVAVAAVAGGVATAIALSSSGSTTIRAGSLGTLSR
ncbi:MAG TPA: tetratricopeptide repeat protein [Polyangia bacterium]|jgi:tetratricopeptide (TPR) repeat protein|nr:tetratricopeptide repeat protein [Polyangia bacterium]